jgi:hypothetical protein
MFFGAKKRKSTRAKKGKSRSHGKVMVKGRERKLYKTKNGALFYRIKSGKRYVNAAFIRKHAVSKRRRAGASPKRRRHRRRMSPRRRRRASPKRRRHRRRTSPKRHRRRSSPRRRHTRRTRYGYGLGQPSLIDMMGPAGLSMHHKM